MMTLPSKATTNNTDSTNSVNDGDDGVGGTEEAGIVEHKVSNGQENVGSSEGTDDSGAVYKYYDNLPIHSEGVIFTYCPAVSPE